MMSLTKTTICKPLVFGLAISMSMPLLSCQRQPHTLNPRLIRVQATVKNSAGRPISGASLFIMDSHDTAVEGPDMVFRPSGTQGQVALYVPASSGFYSVRIYAPEYVTSSVKTTSASQDAALTFVLNKEPVIGSGQRRKVQVHNVQH